VLTHTPTTVFAGKDPSRALATSSLKPEDCVAEWQDLEDKYKTVLTEWVTFFSKRYNVVGKVAGATNA
jgi:membrane-associated progesterone receptor component